MFARLRPSCRSLSPGRTHPGFRVGQVKVFDAKNPRMLAAGYNEQPLLLFNVSQEDRDLDGVILRGTCLPSAMLHGSTAVSLVLFE